MVQMVGYGRNTPKRYRLAIVGVGLVCVVISSDLQRSI
jgi:hypothetical protein